MCGVTPQMLCKHLSQLKSNLYLCCQIVISRVCVKPLKNIWTKHVKMNMVHLLSEWVSEVAPSCLTLCDPMDCNLSCSSIMGLSRQEYWSGLPVHLLGWWNYEWLFPNRFDLNYHEVYEFFMFKAVVPNLFGTRDWFHGRKFFHRRRVEEMVWGWFKCIIFIAYLFLI